MCYIYSIASVGRLEPTTSAKDFCRGSVGSCLKEDFGRVFFVFIAGHITTKTITDFIPLPLWHDESRTTLTKSGRLSELNILEITIKCYAKSNKKTCRCLCRWFQYLSRNGRMGKKPISARRSYSKMEAYLL